MPIFKAHGLKVIDVEKLPTHGGSIRLYVSKVGSSWITSSSVENVLLEESALDPRNKVISQTLQKKALEVKFNLLQELLNCKKRGLNVAAYGAAAKGNTLLNFCGIRQDFVDYVVDKNPHKQGLFTPGTHIPVYSPEKILETKPDFVLILPWNLKEEVAAQLQEIRSWGGNFVVPIPSLQVF